MPMPNKRDDGRELLAAAITPQTADPEQRSVNVIWYTGADVPRVDFWTGATYTLKFDPKGADLSLLNNGAPVLDHHQNADGASGSQKGVVDRAWVDGTNYKATLRFSKRPDVDGLWQDIQDGIVTKFSMGVELLDITEERGKNNELLSRTATSWRPLEISTEPIPADWGTTTLARVHARQGEIMETTTTAGNPAAEKLARDAEIEQLCAPFVKKRNINAAFVEQMKSEGKTVEQTKAEILEFMARESDKNPITSSHEAGLVTRDYADGIQERMADYLASRCTGKPFSDGAKQFAGARVADLARELLTLRGVRPSGWSADSHIREALSGMHTTSDFPNLSGVLTATGTRILLGAYQAAQGAVKQVARRSSANDFRAKMALRIGEAPALLKVNEAGEVKYGTRAEAAESYKLATYARIFAISRQLLVNDDLNAFADATASYGIAAANLESNVLADTLYGAAGVGPTMTDGTALFATSRGNLAGSGGAIGDTTLTAARLALRTTKSLDNSTIIEVNPRFLLAPAAKETEAQKAVAAIYPATTSTANVFQGTLTTLTDPRLDAKSATRWWLFGDPQTAPILEYSYLGGNEGPMVETRQGWEVLGVEFRAVLDFGAGAIGVRGAYCNPGA